MNIKLQKSKYIQLATAYYSFKNVIMQPGFIERFRYQKASEMEAFC